MEPQPNPLSDLIADLDLSLSDNRPIPEEPEFATRIDHQILHEQAEIIHNLKIVIETEPLDYAANSNLLRAISLFERTRARMSRDKQSAARHALRELELNARALHDLNDQPDQPEMPDRDEARHFLESELADGERPAMDIIDRARALGIAQRTLKRAKSELKIQSKLQRTDAQRKWIWSLPASSVSAPSTQNSALAVSPPSI